MEHICADAMKIIADFLTGENYTPPIRNIVLVCKNWRLIAMPIIRHVRTLHLKSTMYPQYVDTYTRHEIGLQHTSEAHLAYEQLNYITKKWLITSCTLDYIIIQLIYRVYSIADDNNEHKSKHIFNVVWYYNDNEATICDFKHSNVFISNKQILRLLFVNAPKYVFKPPKIHPEQSFVKVQINHSRIFKKISLWKWDTRTFKNGMTYGLLDHNFTESTVIYTYKILSLIHGYSIIFNARVDDLYLMFSFEWKPYENIISKLIILHNTLTTFTSSVNVASLMIDKFFLYPPRLLLYSCACNYV